MDEEMRKFKFESLEVWKLSLEVSDKFYEIAERLPIQERFNLSDQVRRAATSVVLNIAEGSTGQSNAEQSRFLGVGIRSVIECVACLRLIERRGYFEDKSMLLEANEACHMLNRKLQAFRRSLMPNQRRLRETKVEYRSRLLNATLG